MKIYSQQMVRSKKFEMYDHGDADKNVEHYGQVRVTFLKRKQVQNRKKKRGDQFVTNKKDK